MGQEVMVNWNAVGAISEFVAAVGVIASLAYVAMQVRQNTAQSKVAIHRATVNELGLTLQGLAASADLASIYVRGLQDYDSLGVEEKVRFSSFMAHLFKLFEELHALHLAGELGAAEWRGFEQAISDLASYPGTQSWWATRSSWLTPEFNELIRSKAAAGERVALYKEQL